MRQVVSSVEFTEEVIVSDGSLDAGKVVGLNENGKLDISVLPYAIPMGGAAGQVLVKKSNSDYDFEWVDLPAGGVAKTTKVFRNTSGEAASLRVATGNAVLTPVLQVTVTGLTSSDKVMLFGQFEVTNNTDRPIGIGRYLSREGQYLVPAVMSNCTPAEHHSVIQCVAVDTTHGGGDHTYILYGYAVCSAAYAGETIRVEPGYGQLVAVVV